MQKNGSLRNSLNGYPWENVTSRTTGSCLLPRKDEIKQNIKIEIP